MNIKYPATIKKIREMPDYFLVSFLDVDIQAGGATLKEALRQGSAGLTFELTCLMDEMGKIPYPSQKKEGEPDDIVYIAPEARIQAALLLRAARGKHTVEVVAGAAKLSVAQVEKLEDLRYWSSLKALDKAASVLGKRLVLSIE